MASEHAMDVESNIHNTNNTNTADGGNNNTKNNNNATRNSNNNNNTESNNNNNNNSDNTTSNTTNSDTNNNNHNNNNNNNNNRNPIQNPYMDVEHHHQSQQLSNIPQSTIDQAVADARQAVVSFLTSRQTEEIVPANSRVVLLDSSILLRHAFRALIENDVRAAPVIDLNTHQYVRLLCDSDALDIILAGRGGPADTTTLGTMILQSTVNSALTSNTKGNNSDSNNGRHNDDTNDQSNTDKPNPASNDNSASGNNNSSNGTPLIQSGFPSIPPPGLISVKATDNLLRTCLLLRDMSSPLSSQPSSLSPLS